MPNYDSATSEFGLQLRREIQPNLTGEKNALRTCCGKYDLLVIRLFLMNIIALYFQINIHIPAGIVAWSSRGPKRYTQQSAVQFLTRSSAPPTIA